jgi:hypothetical protein
LQQINEEEERPSHLLNRCRDRRSSSHQQAPLTTVTKKKMIDIATPEGGAVTVHERRAKLPLWLRLLPVILQEGYTRPRDDIRRKSGVSVLAQKAEAMILEKKHGMIKCTRLHTAQGGHKNCSSKLRRKRQMP